MWMDRKAYDDIRLESVTATTRAQVLAEQNKALQVTLDWLRVRVTQLELERAQLLFNYTGVKVPTPTIQTTDAPESFHRVPHFNDIGDEEANRMGISHNPDGTLRYEIVSRM